MFERFNEKAIKVIMLAQEESRRLGHNFVGTEQVLLGLIGEGTGVAAKVLISMGIKLKDARIEVEKIIGRGSGFVAAEIPFTPRAKRILELSLEEARQLEHNYIGTEHLLLGIIREGEGVATRVLENLDVSLPHVRVRITNILLGTVEEVFNLFGFERFTENIIRAIIFAQEEARQLGDNFIGPEQLLLGLIGEGTGVAAEVLKSMGVTLQNTRIEVKKLGGQSSDIVPGKILFTPKAKRVLELSSKEAKEIGHDHIDTAHLLLGLICEKENVAAKVLESLHVDLSEARTRVINKLGISSLGGKAKTEKRLNKQTYKCTNCTHEIIAIMRPSQCEICGSSPLVTLK